MKYIPDETCSVCHKPFAESAWEHRHTDPLDDLRYCHAGCCPACNGNGPTNRANAIIALLAKKEKEETR